MDGALLPVFQTSDKLDNELQTNCRQIGRHVYEWAAQHTLNMKISSHAGRLLLIQV